MQESKPLSENAPATLIFAYLKTTININVLDDDKRNARTKCLDYLIKQPLTSITNLVVDNDGNEYMLLSTHHQKEHKTTINVNDIHSLLVVSNIDTYYDIIGQHCVNDDDNNIIIHLPDYIPQVKNIKNTNDTNNLLRLFGNNTDDKFDILKPSVINSNANVDNNASEYSSTNTVNAADTIDTADAINDLKSSINDIPNRIPNRRDTLMGLLNKDNRNKGTNEDVNKNSNTHIDRRMVKGEPNKQEITNETVRGLTTDNDLGKLLNSRFVQKPTNGKVINLLLKKCTYINMLGLQSYNPVTEQYEVYTYYGNLLLLCSLELTIFKIVNFYSSGTNIIINILNDRDINDSNKEPLVPFINVLNESPTLTIKLN